ncbi:MAG TPA: MFS transporter [Vicinamibacteria bacterium]|nr:MFS transporter [Vicinamibacteria bacterium]
MNSSSPSWPAWYGVFLLLGIYINSFLDRTILTLLIGPVRGTMGLTDSQVGFLIGPAFAIFYTIAGLPLGWLADRMSRRWLIVIGQAFWSLASVSFGLGRNFFQLSLARIGVGAGEATLTPAAYSIITDLFPSERLGRALSVYSMGIQIGGGMASLLGGILIGWVGESASYRLPLVGERHMWQIVFFLVAAPTVPLTFLLLTTFRDPVRRDGERTARDVAPGEFLRYFRDNAGAFLCHNFGFGLLALSGLAAFSWMPEVLIRIHGWERAFTGKAIGVNSMLVGMAGLYFGGWLGDRWGRLRTDSKLRVGITAVAIWLPFGVSLPLAPTGTLAFGLWVPMTFAAAMPWGAAAAAIQELVPNKMRGRATAVYLFVINIIGLGLGPQLLPLVSDHVFGDEMQIHWALFTVTVAAEMGAAAILAFGLSRFRRAIERRAS